MSFSVRWFYCLMIIQNLVQLTQAMMDCIKRFARSKNRKYDKAVIIFILSHGYNGHISGCDSDGDTVDLNDIFALFSDDACKALRGKPKVFMIDACRERHSGKKLSRYIIYVCILIYKKWPMDNETTVLKQNTKQMHCRYDKYDYVMFLSDAFTSFYQSRAQDSITPLSDTANVYIEWFIHALQCIIEKRATITITITCVFCRVA